MEIQKNELSPVVNTDCVRRDFAEKLSEQVDAIRDCGAVPAFPSCGSLANVAGSTTNDYNGGGDRCNDGSTYDTLQSFIEESGVLDTCLGSHESLVGVLPPGNVSDTGKVVCEAEDDGASERLFESATSQRSQLAFNQSTSSSGFYSKEDAKVNESLDFSNETSGLLMKEKGLFEDFSIETLMRPDEPMFPPVQDIARNFQDFTIDKELDAEFGSSAVFEFHLIPGPTNFFSAEHPSEIGTGVPARVVLPPPLHPPLPPPASATSAAHHVEGSSAGLNISGLLDGSEEGMVASSSSVASGAIYHASLPSQLSLISEESAQDTEECTLTSPPPPPPFVSPGLSDLAVATYRWLRKSGKASRAVLRAGFLPDQICSRHVTVERETNNLVSLAVKQYAEIAEKWFNRAQKKKGRDSYDFKLAFRKTFGKYGKTRVEQINSGAGRKFVLCEKVSQGIYEEMENRAKSTDKHLSDLSSEAHQAMGVNFGRESFPEASLAGGVCVGESRI